MISDLSKPSPFITAIMYITNVKVNVRAGRISADTPIKSDSHMTKAKIAYRTARNFGLRKKLTID